MNEELVKERFKRLNIWHLGKIAPPFKMLLYPTNRCNLECIFCNNTYIRKTERFDYNSELSIKEWEKIVLEGLKMGIRSWWIQGGGEPMVASDKVEKIIEMVKSHRKLTECMLVTNGTLFNEKIIKKFFELSLVEINFSINGPNSKIDNGLRGENAFKKAIESIKIFNRYKKKNKVDKPTIRINSVLTSQICGRIEDFLKLCDRHNIDELVLNPLRLQGEVIDEMEKGNLKLKNLLLSDTMKKKICNELQTLYKVSEELGAKLTINGIEELYPKERNRNGKIMKRKDFISSFCFEPFLTILIGPMGEVGCCCGFEYERSPLNIRNKSLKDVWESKFFSDLRKMMLDNLPLSNCFSCGFKEITERLRLEFKNALST